ncbi:MAG: winged helix-turn-helix transcriptional regulator [Nitrospira sp.]|nr:winged helix-turn-helix transcriptional regulator [Nitrospira sp.]
MWTKKRVKAAVLFHALSDETRLDLLDRLKRGEQCVCELTEALQTGQSRLSFHLRVLKDAGLIHDRPEGRWMYYSLNREGLENLEDFIDELKRAIGRSGPSKQCE